MPNLHNKSKDSTKSKKGRSRNVSERLAVAGAAAAAAGDTSKCQLCKADLEQTQIKCIECERCLVWFCINCAVLTDDEHAFFTSKTARAHWYCTECEAPAVKSVTNDQQIEEKCNQFLGKFETRLDKCEGDIATKADKSDLDTLATANKKLEEKIVGLQRDISTLGSKLNLVRFEPYEKEKRKSNIVIRGLPETGSETEDRDLVKFALSEINCETIIPAEVSRLGKMPAKPSTEENANAPGDQAIAAAPAGRGGTRVPSRPVRCVLLNSDEKKQILQNGKQVRNSVTIRYDPKKVFFIPDQTKLEREDDWILREKLRKSRAENPDKHYIIKGKKVVERDAEGALTGSPTRRRSTTYYANNRT